MSKRSSNSGQFQKKDSAPEEVTPETANGSEEPAVPAASVASAMLSNEAPLPVADDDVPSAALDPMKPSKPTGAAPLRVRPAEDPEELITVRPQRTINKVRCGGQWYGFKQGQPCKVKRGHAKHLREKGIIA